MFMTSANRALSIRPALAAALLLSLVLARAVPAQDPTADLSRVQRGGTAPAASRTAVPAVSAPPPPVQRHDRPGASPSSSPLLLVPGGAVIEQAFNRETTLSASVIGADSPAFRLFLWKFLPAEERDAVTAGLKAAGDGTAKLPALLAGKDQYRWDRGYVFAPEVQAAVRAATGLAEPLFDAAGRIIPGAAVAAAQDRIALALFEYYRQRQANPFEGQPARFEILTGQSTEADRRIEDLRERSFSGAPVVLDAATRAKAAAAKADPAALANLARREQARAEAARRAPVPVPGVEEAERRLAWARRVLAEHHLLDAEGTLGLGALAGGGILDPLVHRALDTLHRYALEGEPLLPGATFPRTTNAVRLLFGHKSDELLEIFREAEKMMDTATRAIWVDLFYLGGALSEPAGKDNMGVRMLRYLERRKREGIDVRLILSPQGTGFTPEATHRFAVDTLGARIYNLAALPGGMPTRVDHDKLIVIDHGRAAMVGTMNFDVNARGFGGHHETVSLVRGPAAAILAWSHQANWRLAGGADAAGDDEAIRKAMAADPGAATGEEALAPVWVTLTHPVITNTPERTLDWINSTARGEELRVWMFQFGDREVVEALVNAVRRGVKLRMISDPLAGPVKQTPFLPNLAGFAPIQDAMTAAGNGGAIHLLERAALDTYMHSKVAVFGNARFTLGSTNWTHVGMRRNAELSIWVESEPLAKRLVDRFEADLKAESSGRPVFPTIEAYRAAHPTYGQVDRQFLDRVARMMDEFF